MLTIRPRVFSCEPPLIQHFLRRMPSSCFKPDTLTNSVALVTGGSSGIGFEIARQLGLHGATVFISGRRKDVLDAATNQLRAQGISATGLQGDVRKQDSCDAWVGGIAAQFGQLDILVNCAGIILRSINRPTSMSLLSA